MQNKCKLSFIIPVYNGEQYINGLWSSFDGLMFDDYECIFVDDGSEDKTVEAIKNIGDVRIKILKSEHLGVSAARNLGIAESSGEYLVFLDVDDFIIPKGLNTIYSSLLNGYDLVWFDYIIRNEQKDVALPRLLVDGVYDNKEGKIVVKDLISREEGRLDTTRGYIYQYVIKRDFVIANKILFDSNAVIKEDLMFSLLLFDNVGRFYSTSATCYIHNIIQGSAVHKYRSNIFNELMYVYSIIAKYSERPFKILSLYAEKALSSILQFEAHDIRKQKIHIVLSSELISNNKKEILKNCPKRKRVFFFLIFYFYNPLFLLLYDVARKIKCLLRG